MKLSAKTFGKADRRAEIKNIYLEAFPAEERLPWWVLRFLTVRRGIDITAYYEADRLCGFTYGITAGNILFLLFFAVKDELRGKGYGSAILGYLKENHPGKTILLNVEPLDPKADNFEERVRRFRFYEKNGFYDTQYDIEEVGGVFRVLATAPSFEQKEYLRVFGRMSFCFWKPKITRTGAEQEGEQR